MNAELTTTVTQPAIADPPQAVVAKTDPAQDHRTATESCTALVETHYKRVFAWYYWLTGRRELAADLTQGAFAAFWESLGRCSPARPELWLFVIARNKWKSHCRRQQNRRTEPLPHDAVLVDDSAVTPTSDLCERLQRQVALLPAVYRESLILRFWSGLSPVQIARVLGVPAALVRWRVHRATRLLREAMPDQLVEEFLP